MTKQEIYQTILQDIEKEKDRMEFNSFEIAMLHEQALILYKLLVYKNVDLAKFYESYQSCAIQFSLFEALTILSYGLFGNWYNKEENTEGKSKND